MHRVGILTDTRDKQGGGVSNNSILNVNLYQAERHPPYYRFPTVPGRPRARCIEHKDKIVIGLVVAP